ncbi:hypothetical protein D038_3544B, partial [Vibrio parahaemolyticus IDH02189]
KEIGDP